MIDHVALIGFGEAAQAFAPAIRARLIAYDCKTDDPTDRGGKIADYDAAGIAWCESAGEAVAGADAILSLVTADQARIAAERSGGIKPGAFWFDFNSVSPEAKREAAASVRASGGRYVDVAVLAPVHPQGASVPLLVSGPDAEPGAETLRQIGFTRLEVVEGPVGAASAVKMVRSVMVKGIEALCLECALAAEVAGVRDLVIASLEASWPGAGWAGRFDYNLERMMVHGTRRAAEMDEVTATLDSFGTGAVMSRATAERQRQIGALALTRPPAGLAAKLDLILRQTAGSRRERAA